MSTRGAWLLLAALVAAAAWNPSWPTGAGAIDLLVAVDGSASVAAEASRNAGDALAGTLAGLPGGSRVTAYGFAAGSADDVATGAAAAALRTAGDAALARHASDLAGAVDTALQLARPGRPGRLLLLSDGLATRGDTAAALRRADAAGMPVYLLQPAAERPPTARLGALQLPASAPAGRRVTVATTLHSDSARRLRVAWEVDGRPVGSTWLDAPPGRELAVTREIVVPRGSVAVTARLEGSAGQLLDRRTRRLRGVAVTAPLHVGDDGASALADALERGGRPAQRVTPQRLSRNPLALAEHPLLILDDLPHDALDAAQWAAIEHAVKALGSGLLVLGGPHSFAPGGYRGTPLEALLPVTAETTAPQPAAALLYVVDTSGSMDRDAGGANRLALARQAVVASAAGLERGDAVGLLGFAATPRLLLPLARHDDPGAALDSAWEATASGGTALGPALLDAIDELAAAPLENRLLVLVSDGIVGDLELAPLRDRALRAGIRIVIVAVGPNARSTRLAALAAPGDLYRVAAIAELPRLLRRAVDGSRHAVVAGPVTPRAGSPLPWMVRGDWPPLDAYQATRPRDGATLYLQAPGGDPLFAAWQAGAGRVVALPGGLDGWATAWHGWDSWGGFIGGLVEWNGRSAAAGYRSARLRTGTDGARQLVIDIAAGDDRWLQQDAVAVTAVDANGRDHRLDALSELPGRYVAELPALAPGALAVQAAGRRFDLWLDDDDERLPPRRAYTDRDAWLSAGLLRAWPAPGRLPAGLLPPDDVALRPWLAAAALFWLIGLLIAERLPATGWNPLRTSTVENADAIAAA